MFEYDEYDVYDEFRFEFRFTKLSKVEHTCLWPVR